MYAFLIRNWCDITRVLYIKAGRHYRPALLIWTLTCRLIPPPLHCEWSRPLFNGCCCCASALSKSTLLLLRWWFFLRLRLGRDDNFHEHFRWIFLVWWLLLVVDVAVTGSDTTFSLNVIVFVPIFSLCVTILLLLDSCSGGDGGWWSLSIMSGGGGRSNCRNVRGGGDRLGGFNNVKLCEQRINV